MAGLSAPRILFGVHSITPYSLVDRTPYGLLKVIGDAKLDMSTDIETLYAGPNRFPWTAEPKIIKTMLTAKVKAYPGFAFSLFLGASVTESLTPTGGSVGTPQVQVGTLIDATVGVASISVIPTTGAANLKFGKYLAVAASATTVALYAYSDIAFADGASETFLDDSLKVSESPLTITSAGQTDVTSLGLRFTGGSGTIGMTTGDSVWFEVLESYNSNMKVTVGASGTTFPNFGAIFYAQKRGDGEMFEIEAFNVIGAGLPIDLAEMKFSEPELKMTCLYSATNNAVLEIRHIVPQVA